MANVEARKFEIVASSKVRCLKKAFRVAADRGINAEEALEALEHLRKLGTWGKNLAH